MNPKSSIVMKFLEHIRNRQLSHDSAYEHTNLLEGLDPEGRKIVIQLIENQVVQILYESQSNPGSMSERGDIFEDQQVNSGVIVLPLVQKVYSELFAKEIVGTQPTCSPDGFINYADSDSSLKREYLT